MLEHLTAVKLFALTVATVFATLLLFGIIIVLDPPAFFGYVFGAINGANWFGLIVLYARYWEESA